MVSPTTQRWLIAVLVVSLGVFAGQILFLSIKTWLTRLLERHHAARWSNLFSLQSPPAEVSKRRAQERRAAILELSRRSENPLSRFLVGYEFLESPPDFRDMRVNEFGLESPDAIAQAVRLRWELESDELLLADRVVDAVVALARTGGPPFPFEERSFVFPYPYFERYPSVKLIHEEKVLGTELFPWSVIIETHFPQSYSEGLRPIADWLGIGIRFRPPSRVVLQGKCEIGSGMKGIVGGVLRGSRGTLGMTCAHVLSPECKSVVCTCSPNNAGNQPDAALIGGSSRCPRCFAMPDGGHRCDVATEGEMRESRRRKQLVRKGRFSRKRGYISCPVLEFESEGRTFRFPHIQIVPLTIPLLGRFSALFERAFSYEGDSGTWVFNEKTGQWLGMIVAGDPDQRVSYAAEAAPLLDYFRLRLGDPGLSPYD